jgi:hypothetical protein
MRESALRCLPPLHCTALSCPCIVISELSVASTAQSSTTHDIGPHSLPTLSFLVSRLLLVLMPHCATYVLSCFLFFSFDMFSFVWSWSIEVEMDLLHFFSLLSQSFFLFITLFSSLFRTLSLSLPLACTWPACARTERTYNCSCNDSMVDTIPYTYTCCSKRWQTQRITDLAYLNLLYSILFFSLKCH